MGVLLSAPLAHKNIIALIFVQVYWRFALTLVFYLATFALVFVQIILYTKDVIGGELMPLKFKINVLDALKQAGYNTSRIRQENLLSQSTLQKLRDGGQFSWSNLETICRLLECQPGDILEYIPPETEH